MEERIITKISKFYPDGRPQILRCVEDDRTIGVIFRYQRTDKTKSNESYRVYGKCFDLLLSKIHPISSTFSTLDDARLYFTQLIEKYPQSHIYIYREVIQDIEAYV